MVVDADGMVLTARDHPRMLAVAATAEGRGLTLTGPHADPLQVSPAPGTPTRRVRIWNDDVDAVDAGDEAAAWFTALLGVPARLVWLDDPTRRPVDPDYGTADDRVSFADATRCCSPRPPRCAGSTTGSPRARWSAARSRRNRCR